MNDDIRWHLLIRKKFEAEIVSAFRYLRQNGVEPILIKGWAAARLYPSDVPRSFDDIDLAVSSADYETAKRLLQTGDGMRLGIDLHRELRHLDTRAWQEIYQDSQLILLDGVEIRIPSPEDHFRILCVHWLNDGGENKDRLRDVYYAVQNRPEEFNWEQCLESVGETRRRWIIAAVGLAHRYLNLNIDDLPFAEEAKGLPSWLTSTVEKEWRNNVRLRSLHTCLHDWKAFSAQIRKRLPPNPVTATIEMEGAFDEKSRLYYQLGSMYKRVLPSIKGIYGTIRRRP